MEHSAWYTNNLGKEDQNEKVIQPQDKEELKSDKTIS